MVCSLCLSQEPMDLITIERKVEERVYTDKEEFERDVHLVFDNCIEYHGGESGQLDIDLLRKD